MGIGCWTKASVVVSTDADHSAIRHMRRIYFVAEYDEPGLENK